MKEIRRIVVLVLDLMNCREAVRTGAMLARKHGAELVILHIQHDPLGAEGFNLPFLALTDEYLRLLREAKETLSRIIDEERTGGLTIRERVVEGDPVRKVLEAVKEEKADLLVMLSHEQGKFEHLLFGHFHDEIVRRMPCSIFLAKKEPAP
jgi:nucleotide-binding universal stress UspA family protein